VRDKNNDAVAHRFADGVEITARERFLADSPGNAADMFALLKRESDSIR
jgi:hypothetical protein